MKRKEVSKPVAVPTPGKENNPFNIAAVLAGTTDQLIKAEELLKQCGYERQPDGTYAPLSIVRGTGKVQSGGAA